MAFEFLPGGIDINAMDNRCYGCGDPHLKGVAAFRAEAFEDFLGQIEICERCVKTMAESLGLMPAKKHDFVKETNQRLIKEREEQDAQIARLKHLREEEADAHKYEVEQLKAEIEKVRVRAVQKTEERMRVELSPSHRPRKAKA